MRHLMLALLPLLLAACNAATPTIAPPSPTASYLLVRPGETLRLPVEPQAGPTAEYPTLTFHLRFQDEVSGNPVRVRAVILGGQEIGRDVTEITFQMPGDTMDYPLEIRVEADGYQLWGLVFRHRVKYSRHMYWDVVLVRQIVDSRGTVGAMAAAMKTDGK